MAHMHKKVLVTLKLPQLQNLMKRDPAAYKEEFLMQQRHFQSELDIFKLRPTLDSERFTELVNFMCHVASCYKEDTTALPTQLVQLLEEHAFTLHPDVRAKVFQSVIILRNKGVLEPLILLRLSFKLFAVPDKSLRTMLGEYIVHDIKTINQNKNNDKLNRSIQALLFNIVSTDDSISARKTVDILADLYRRRIWTDARTVNVIGSACTSPITRVFVTAINFFLGIESKMFEDEEDDKVISSAAKQIDRHEHSKKTRKRIRLVKKQVEQVAKARREADAKEITPLFPAIQLLHDPQELSEKLFKKLRQTGERFEVKLLLMNFISRLVGCHKLILLSFYSFLQKYLTSHQQNVTKILAYLIQACHDLIPPEEILPIVKAIAYNFISDRCSTEVITVGINTVREIICRIPAILREPGMDDFVQDLVLYSRKTHKSVMIAAHSVLNLIRELYPALLRRADRGKFHDLSARPSEYGESRAAEGVAGTELLEAYERGDVFLDEDGEIVWRDEQPSTKDGGDGEGDFTDDDEGEEEEEEEEEEEVEDDDDDDENGDGWVDVDDGEDDDDEDDKDDEDDEEDEEEEEEEDEEEDDEENEEEEVEPMLVKVADDGSILSERTSSRRSITERVEAKRLLTQEDFALLARLRAAQKERQMDPRFKKKGNVRVPDRDSVTLTRDALEEEDAIPDPELPKFAIEPDSLAPSVRVRKMTKIERISRVLEGRKESNFEHEGHKGGLTNKEKERKKNFMMVRKGKVDVKGKLRKSNSDQRYEKMKAKEQFGRDRRKRRRT